MKSLCLLLLLLLPNDWPKFRGAQADAHAPGPPTPMQWSDSENVRWKVSVPGLGWSSPSVVGKRLWLTTAVPDGNGLSLRCLCLDADSGKTLWDTEVRKVAEVPKIHTKNSHASPTPIVDKGSVYVHFGALGMARLNADDGKIVWLNTELVYPPLHGSGGSPVLHDGLLAIVCDGSTDPFVAAVEAESGKVLWKQFRSIKARISHSFVTVSVAEVDGKALVMAPGPDHFAAYDLHTGDEVFRVLAPGWSVVPQPIVAHGLVIYNHDYDNPELMAVRLGGKGDVTETHVAWRQKRGAPSTPTPLLIGEDLYYVSDDGIASCVNAVSGERYWMERLGGNFSASPVFANGHVLFMDETGHATWIKPTRTFETVGKCEVPGRTLATPAFANASMYLRTDEFLYRIAAP